MNLAGECASMHHDATMLELGVRTTIDLPDDLHKQALAIARDTHRTLSDTVADLMRRGLGAGRTAALSEDPRTGLPLVSVGTVVTSEDVRALEDGAWRPCSTRTCPSPSSSPSMCIMRPPRKGYRHSPRNSRRARSPREVLFDSWCA